MTKIPAHPDKLVIQKIVYGWLDKSKLKASYIANRLQIHCPIPITPDNFGNLFLYHPERKPNVDGDILLALITVFSVDVPIDSRCSADEVIDLIVRVPMSLIEFKALVEKLEAFFSKEELSRACLRYDIYLNFANQFEDMRGMVNQLRQQYGDFVLRFLMDQLVHGRLRDRYWEAFIDTRDQRSIALIDREWRTIKQVLTWVAKENPDLLVDLVMLLVHYMDERLLYSDRIKYSHLAADAASKLGNRQWEEAILRIDALGWMYLELDQFKQAEEQINRGLQIAEAYASSGVDTTELFVLGNTWLARLHLYRYLRRLEPDGLEAAYRQIESIRTSSAQCRPVIQNRVKMVTGDIAIHDARSGIAAAISLYQEGLSYFDVNFGLNLEADSLPLNNKLGMAYWQAGEIEMAEARFNDILRLDAECLTINGVRAQLNMAQIEKLKGNLSSARERAAKVRNRLAKLKIRHPMLVEAEDLLSSLKTKQ
ncbi:MAG: hypothetical protein U0528_00285 [Anaerolineae bacterium]